MENEKAIIGALLFILLVIGANFIMYGIVRGAANSRGNGFWETFTKSLNARTKKEDSMDELRQKVEELKKGEKDENTPRRAE